MRSPSSSLRRCLLLVGVFVAALGVGWPAPVHAHNTFESSSPAEGDVLAQPPTQISLVFTKSVPLDSASVQITDSTGVRQDALSLAHGPLGDRELIAQLPATVAGEVSVRWRLVGADGHPITERITFTVTAAVESTTVEPAAPTPTTPVSPAAVNDEEPFSTPSVVRWLARYLSYLALLVVVGVALTDALIWHGAGQRPLLARLVSRSLGAIGVLALMQLLVLASDIEGVAPWSALGSMERAVGTTAGLALLVRAALAATAWLVLRRMQISSVEIRWAALGAVGVALMATWAAAGHASSQRWPEFGVLLDVTHHSAAGFWLGSLGIVGLFAIPALSAAELGGVVQQLSRWATVSVALVAGTGVAQALRLGDGPGTLFSTRHGGLLAGKVVLFAIMVFLGALNRRRLAASVGAAGLSPATVRGLRQSILVEVALGLVVFALTASLVVAVPEVAL